MAAVAAATEPQVTSEPMTFERLQEIEAKVRQNAGTVSHELATVIYAELFLGQCFLLGAQTIADAINQAR